MEKEGARKSEDRLTDHRQNVIVVIVTNVERQIAINAFERARPDQTTRAARPNAFLHRVFREMLDDVTRATACELRFEIATRLPTNAPRVATTDAPSPRSPTSDRCDVARTDPSILFCEVM